MLSATPLALADMPQNDLAIAQAEYEQGNRHYYGRGTKKDLDKALDWYMKSAEKGQIKSELAVSQVLSFGDFGNRQFDAALPWLIKASKPHTNPQISGAEAAKASAEKNLRWMCKKGLVDFPDSHPYAQDPYCWLKRGNRLFNGDSRINYFLLKDKSKYYGIKRDYVAARHYLEKAFDAGKETAAKNLAAIYINGLGTSKDIDKANYYLEIASEKGHGKSSYYLAEQALAEQNHELYIAKLHLAAQEAHRKALRKLAWAYYNGEYVEQNNDTAFMYFFLVGQGNYVRARDARHGDTRLPFIENKFLQTFKTEISLELLEKSRDDALSFAKKNKFRSYQTKKIKRSYNIAVSDFHYVKETGGEWHQSGLSLRLLYYFMFFVAIITLKSIVRFFVEKS